ncbi:MAG: hypothetical protein L0H84_22015 [Pseudonocardia sp.]|nr:hypothetical protein [Pseudonocardia sp.]
MPATHRESHRELLRRPGKGRPRAIDAIVVPAHRSAPHLDPAAQLATELGCRLLLMCDPDGVDPEDFAERAPPGLVWHAVTVPADYEHPVLPASALPRRDQRDWRHGALATKRNLAVLIARLMRFTTIVLVDDDIIDLDPAAILRATEGLNELRAVGLEVAQFPDNSVVCHANRLSRTAHQDVFIGACALVLDVSTRFGFFPHVYNEDWLFLFDNVADRLVGRIGVVGQEPYDPFADPARARAEEFGDVIAEGLMSALRDRSAAGPPMDHAYWQDFLAARAAFIERAGARVPRDDPQIDVDKVIGALDAAVERLAQIDAAMCVEFVRCWRADLRLWHAHLAGLPAVTSFGAAMDYLDLGATLADMIA